MVTNFYGTEIEIWAGFGPLGNTDKNIWADYEQLFKTTISSHFLSPNGQGL